MHEATEPKPWKIGNSVPDYDGMLKTIVVIEISITRLEGKAKLSQNREDRDRLNSADVLEKQGGLLSTPPEKSATQKFRPAGPVRSVDTNRTAHINFSQNHQNATRLKALQHIV